MSYADGSEVDAAPLPRPPARTCAARRVARFCRDRSVATGVDCGLLVGERRALLRARARLEMRSGRRLISSDCCVIGSSFSGRFWRRHVRRVRRAPVLHLRAK